MTARDKRPNSLQAVLMKAATQAPFPSQTAEESAEAAAPQKAFSRPSREGKRLVAGHFEPQVARQLRLLAAEEDTTIQALLEEALNLLFVKKGKQAIER